MSSGPTEPEEEAMGLKLVDEPASDEIPAEPPRTAPVETRTDRRRLPVWIFVVALILFCLVVGWQAQVASVLEAEVISLGMQLEETNALLDAHRTHLSEIRGGVRELSERLMGLRTLVDSDPMPPPTSSPTSAAPPLDGAAEGLVPVQ